MTTTFRVEWKRKLILLFSFWSESDFLLSHNKTNRNANLPSRLLTAFYGLRLILTTWLVDKDVCLSVVSAGSIRRVSTWLNKRSNESVKSLAPTAQFKLEQWTRNAKIFSKHTLEPCSSIRSRTMVYGSIEKFYSNTKESDFAAALKKFVFCLI